jgi:hypothetical protein
MKWNWARSAILERAPQLGRAPQSRGRDRALALAYWDDVFAKTVETPE